MRKFSVFISVLLILSCFLSVSAAAECPVDPVSTRSLESPISTQSQTLIYTYSDLCLTALGDLFETECEASFEGIDEVYHVALKITLEKKKTVLLWSSWEEVTHWSMNFYKYSGTMVRNYEGLSSGTYRIKAEFTVYYREEGADLNDYSEEVVTVYSPERKTD